MKLRGLIAVCLLMVGLAPALGQTLLPNARQTFLDQNGQPLAAGTVGFYIPNTLTPKTTWSDQGESTPNANPVVLDAGGKATIWGSGSYREIVKDVFGNTIWDGVTTGVTTQAPANTMSGNWTSATADLANNAMPSCADTGGNHLNYVTNTGITCGNSSPSTISQNYFTGLILSTAGASSSFGITAGSAADTTNAYLMSLGSAINKTTGSWAVGNNQGCLDTGAIAATTWYYVYAIERVDTNVTDILCSLSATSPTMPTNYTVKRRIGAMLTDGSSHWTKFFERPGLLFYWDVMTSNTSGTFMSTASILATLSVPPGLNVNALFNMQIDAASNNDACVVTDPNQIDTAPSGSAETTQAGIGTAGAAIRIVNQLAMTVNTSNQVRLKCANGSASYHFYTVGWYDTPVLAGN